MKGVMGWYTTIYIRENLVRSAETSTVSLCYKSTKPEFILFWK